MKILSFLIKIFIINLFIVLNVNSEIIDKIIIKGNERISNETIKLFSGVDTGTDIYEIEINSILKDLYQTNYFENVNVSFQNNVLLIAIKEYPIIQSINYKGIKSNKLLEAISEGKLIKEKLPFNENLLASENNRLKKIFKELGYYNSSFETSVIKLDDNLISLNFDIEIRLSSS